MSGRERLEHHDKARYTVDSVEPVHRPIIHDSDDAPRGCWAWPLAEGWTVKVRNDVLPVAVEMNWAPRLLPEYAEQLTAVLLSAAALARSEQERILG